MTKGISLTDTIHHLPGRLRLRMDALRRNPPAVLRAERAVAALPGVVRAEASTLTGSLLVQYDPRRLAAPAILAALAGAGFTPPRQPARPLESLADTALSLAVDKLFEHGATALLAALI